MAKYTKLWGVSKKQHYQVAELMKFDFTVFLS